MIKIKKRRRTETALVVAKPGLPSPAKRPPLQKLRLADLRIPWLVFVFLWIDWVGERMKQFFWLGLNTLLPVVLAALCYLALCRDGVSWLRRSESV
jgi:hypothetical protein